MPSADPLVLTLQEWIGTFMRRSMRNFIHYSKETGLSMSQIGALFQINHGRSNVSDLGEGLGITNAAVSQMLDRLVQDGLILRSEDPQDRRAKQLVLTDKGRRIMQETIQARQGWIEDLVSKLNAGEKEQIATALRVLIDRIDLLDRTAEAKAGIER